VLKAEDVTVVLKTGLIEPRIKVRRLTHTRVCELADKIRIAMGCH